MKFKIRFADKIVGFFSLVAIAGLVALILSIGASNNWFAKRNNFYTCFESGEGLNVGMDLTYKGFSIGKIKSIKLEGAMVRVDYYVLGEYAEYVKENSLVEFAVSPIGLGSSFKLYPGKSPRALENGCEIFRTDSQKGLELIAAGKIVIENQSDSIGALMNKVALLLDYVNALASNINTAVEGKGETSLRKLLDNVVLLTGNLNGVLRIFMSQDGAVPKLLGPELAGEIS